MGWERPENLSPLEEFKLKDQFFHVPNTPRLILATMELALLSHLSRESGGPRGQSGAWGALVQVKGDHCGQ